MASVSTDFVRRLRVPGYCTLFLVAAAPLLQLAVAAWPFTIHEIAWRLGVYTVAANSLGAATLGVFLLLALATASGDRAVLWTIAVACSLGVALCIVALGAFSLDALQMRAQVMETAARKYTLASTWVAVQIALWGCMALILAISAVRTARGMSREERLAAKAGPLIVKAPKGVAEVAPTPAGKS